MGVVLAAMESLKPCPLAGSDLSQLLPSSQGSIWLSVTNLSFGEADRSKVGDWEGSSMPSSMASAARLTTEEVISAKF